MNLSITQDAIEDIGAMTRSSKELLEKMQTCLDSMKQVLRDPNLPADVKIDDINTWCWAVIECAQHLQQAVRDELEDTD
jgi:hypothetical protein